MWNCFCFDLQNFHDFRFATLTKHLNNQTYCCIENMDLVHIHLTASQIFGPVLNCGMWICKVRATRGYVTGGLAV